MSELENAAYEPVSRLISDEKSNLSRASVKNLVRWAIAAAIVRTYGYEDVPKFNSSSARAFRRKGLAGLANRQDRTPVHVYMTRTNYRDYGSPDEALAHTVIAPVGGVDGVAVVLWLGNIAITVVTDGYTKWFEERRDAIGLSSIQLFPTPRWKVDWPPGVFSSPASVFAALGLTNELWHPAPDEKSDPRARR